MARRPTDYTAQMQAAEQRRRQQDERQRKEAQREQQLLERQALNQGRVALDILGARTTIDVLAGMLLENRDRVRATPELEAEWAARGAAYFRPAGNRHREQPAASGGATGNATQPANPPAREPSRPRAMAPAGGPDLLGGLAPDRAGAGTTGEGGGHGQQS